MKRYHILLVIAGLLLAFCGRTLYKSFNVNEEDRIAKQLDGLIESFEKTDDETLFAARDRAKETVAFFAPDFSAEPGPPFNRVESGTDFINMITGFRLQTSKLTISRISRDIRYSGNEADVLTTLRANYNGMGDRGGETRTFQIKLVKLSGDWLVRRVDRVN